MSIYLLDTTLACPGPPGPPHPPATAASQSNFLATFPPTRAYSPVRVQLAYSSQPSPLPPFADIVRQHQAMVYSIGWHFLRDRSVAEDLAQDVFLGLHKNLKTIESPSHLTNWLRQTMTRRCIDWSRRSAQKSRASLEAVKEPSAPAQHSDPFVTDHVAKAMSSLPERSRMMVVLRYQEDLDPTEIADLLAVPVGTVKSTLHRALGVMRARLERIRTRMPISPKLVQNNETRSEPRPAGSGPRQNIDRAGASST